MEEEGTPYIERNLEYVNFPYDTVLLEPSRDDDEERMAELVWKAMVNPGAGAGRSVIVQIPEAPLIDAAPGQHVIFSLNTRSLTQVFLFFKRLDKFMMDEMSVRGLEWFDVSEEEEEDFQQFVQNKYLPCIVPGDVNRSLKLLFDEDTAVFDTDGRRIDDGLPIDVKAASAVIEIEGMRIQSTSFAPMLLLRQLIIPAEPALAPEQEPAQEQEPEPAAPEPEPEPDPEPEPEPEPEPVVVRRRRRVSTERKSARKSLSRTAVQPVVRVPLAPPRSRLPATPNSTPITARPPPVWRHRRRRSSSSASSSSSSSSSSGTSSSSGSSYDDDRRRRHRHRHHGARHRR